MKRKVLFIITGVNTGGLETYLLRFLQFKKNDLMPVVLYKNDDVNKEFYKDFKNAGAEMVLLPITMSPISMYKFYVFLRMQKVNVICDFRGDFAGIPLFVAWLANIKNRIVFYRESRFQFTQTFYKSIYTKWLHLLTQKFSTKILSNSNDALNNFYKKNELKKKYQKVIRNGVYIKKTEEKDFNEDVRKKHGIPKNAFVIGHVGRYTPAKNHSLLVEIAKELYTKHEDIYMLLCGKGIAESINDELIENKIKDKVIMPGLCKNIPSYLKAMDVFVFPSFNEGQPNALIEAIIEGVPIIASNIATIKETVHVGMYKVLFEPSDKKSFLKEVLKIKNGQTAYNIDDAKKWSKKEYSQKDRFEEFFLQLT